MDRVVIIGGGFGGLNAARCLRRLTGEVTLIDRRNHHLFQPLLYQVATGGLSPANIAAPLRSLLHTQRNARVILGEVQQIDIAQQRVTCDVGAFPYDILIVAAGSTHSYFSHPEWEAAAPGLKSLEDATRVRAKILSAFESAEVGLPESVEAWLTFVLVGGGPTGVELAGAIAELARHTLRHDFRRIQTSRARIVLVEGAARILPHFSDVLSQRATAALQRLGVEVRTSTIVTEIGEEAVRVQSGTNSELIAARTVLWSAGVATSPLAKQLAAATGQTLDRAGRIPVQADCSIAGHSNLFVLGDMARFEATPGQPLPGLAPVAMQQGRYVARLLRARQAGKSLPPFQYRDRGTMAVVAPFYAVASLRGWNLSGLLAWLAWLFIHLIYIAQFQNRVLVLLQWAWHYMTRNSSARLITRSPPREC